MGRHGYHLVGWRRGQLGQRTRVGAPQLWEWPAAFTWWRCARRATADTWDARGGGAPRRGARRTRERRRARRAARAGRELGARCRHLGRALGDRRALAPRGARPPLPGAAHIYIPIFPICHTPFSPYISGYSLFFSSSRRVPSSRRTWPETMSYSIASSKRFTWAPSDARGSSSARSRACSLTDHPRRLTRTG